MLSPSPRSRDDDFIGVEFDHAGVPPAIGNQADVTPAIGDLGSVTPAYLTPRKVPGSDRERKALTLQVSEIAR